MLSGHGEPITDHRGADRRALRACTERRARKIHGLIAERPRTAHEIAQALWGNVAVTQAFLTLSEVLGHVDLLQADGKVREHDDDGVVRFESVARTYGGAPQAARAPISGGYRQSL